MASSCSWTQTHSDIDVQIPLPQPGVASKDIAVRISSDAILVRLADGEPLLDGKFPWPVKPAESCWTRATQYIHVSLEKATPRWWDSLLDGKPALEPSCLDKSKPLEDLSSEEQMKVQELMWRHHERLRRAGASST